jgi:hypothetical protein
MVSAQETSPEQSQASLGTGFTYQGELQEGGAPVNAVCDFQFKLWNAASGGGQVGTTQTVNNVSVSNGLFSVLLNDSSQFGSSAFDGNARWLELAVRCPAGGGTFTALAPRQVLAATPYALYSQSASWNSLFDVPSSFADGVDNDTTYTAGSGLALDDGTFSVQSLPWTSLSGVPADFADNTDNDTTYSAGTGLSLNNNAFQVQFAGSGSATTASRSDHNHGGQNWIGNAPFGLRIENDTTDSLATGIIGVVTQSSSGAGIEGRHESTTGSGSGVFGGSSSDSGIGTSGYAASLTGNTKGVFGLVASSAGVGVSGHAASPTGLTIGVIGSSESVSGTGIAGIAYAVSGANIGVYGSTNSLAGWAGYFRGDVNITGTLYKSAGSFRIDHPLDPEHKYLSHSFVESPDMMNVYNGNITLDANGEGWVELPSYFEALNQDFRYQLTAVGAPGPNLYIAEPVSNNRFKIAGGTSNLVVSWQVTGIRHDSYALEHPIIVEQDKPAGEVNSFAIPQISNQSIDQSAHANQQFQYEVSQANTEQQTAASVESSAVVTSTWENR